MFEFIQYEFVRNALMAGVLISIACGIMGALVVVNRMVFISGSIAHTSYGGIGIAFFFGFSPLLGAAGFAVAAALIMGLLSIGKRYRTDTVIGAVWAVGMATGIIMVDLTPGYHTDLMSYLFGSILSVPAGDLILMLALDIIVVASVTVLYRPLLSLLYDDEFAMLRGVPVRALYLFLLVLTALTIVMTIRIVGLILVIALLTIPTYLAEKHAHSLPMMMLISALLSMIFVTSGLWLSYLLNLTSGATIILVAASVFFLDFLRDAVIIRVKTP